MGTHIQRAFFSTYQSVQLLCVNYKRLSERHKHVRQDYSISTDKQARLRGLHFLIKVLIPIEKTESRFIGSPRQSYSTIKNNT